MRLVQIVPELPPAVGGVGDYASLLASELRRVGNRTTFVIPERHRSTAQHPRPAELPEVTLVAPRAGELIQRLDALCPDMVLLHYSGYGFAARGAPVWLVQGLRRWKAHASGCRLVVIEQFLPPLRAAGIEALLDIGPPVEEGVTARSPLPVTRCGYLEAPLASAAVLRARFGLLDRPLDFAAKSGVLAAYAAHGLVPVIRTRPVGGAPDRLRHGVNIVRTDREPIPGLRELAQQLATAARHWYRAHGAGPTAVGFGQALRSPSDLHRRA